MATSAPNSAIRRLLELVGIGNDLIQNFEEQDITAEIVSILSNAQLIQLGLTTIATTGSSFYLPKSQHEKWGASTFSLSFCQ